MAWALRRWRAGRHSCRKRSIHSQRAGSSPTFRRKGASVRPSERKAIHGAAGLDHGSGWLTEICPPLAKLVSSAGPGWRSTTLTSKPACNRYQAVVTPVTPAPRTITCIEDQGGIGAARWFRCDVVLAGAGRRRDNSILSFRFRLGRTNLEPRMARVTLT